MNRTYFVISDIHGHFDEMIECLTLSKYDKHNSRHQLLVLGDMFDRGNKSKEVLEFIYKLHIEKKVSLILGNHEAFLIEFLEGNFKRAGFNMKMNGFKITLESLIGRKLSFEDDWDKVSCEIRNKYSFLLDFLNSIPLYLETKEYIFVHGGIKYGEKDWKESSKRDFLWGKESQYERVPNKIVICGHERVSKIRFPTYDQNLLIKEHPEAFDILKDKGKIHIDAYVEISKKINVLKLEIKDEDFM